MNHFYMCQPVPFEIKPVFKYLHPVNPVKFVKQRKSRKIQRQTNNFKRK